MTITALSFIKDDAKKIKALIQDAGTIYQKRDDYLQMAGAVSVFHAAQHGDPVFIQQFYDVLSKGHKLMFRTWLGKVTRYATDEGGVGFWLGFKDEKFFVKPNTHNVRVGSIDENTIVANLWMKKEKVEGPAPTEEQAYKALIESAEKRVDLIEKLFEKAHVTMPKALVDAFKELDAVLATLK